MASAAAQAQRAAAALASGAARRQRMADRLAAGKRWCNHCRSWLPLSAFSADPSAAAGLRSWCRACNAASGRQQRLQRASQAAAAARRQQMLDQLATGTRQCPACGRCRPLDAFAANRSRASGRDYQCRDCRAAYFRARRATLTGHGTLAAEPRPPPRPLPGWVLKCCGGRLADDPEARWWVAVHQPGCADPTWQPTLTGARTRRPPKWNRILVPA